MRPEISILTLMSGRWYSMEPYLQGLAGLDYPKDRISLLWYTNAQDQDYLGFASDKLIGLKKMGYEDANLIVDHSIRVSGNAHTQGGLRTVEHAVAIASLYNSAWNHLKSKNRVFFLEDDVAAPSHSLNRLMDGLDKSKAFHISGVQFDRHSHSMFSWMVDKEPIGYRRSKKAMYIAYPPRETWGVKQIGASHLGCTLIDPTRIPKKLKRPLFRPQSSIKGAEHFIGCDIVLCVEGQIAGGECLIDYDVRAFHYDSTGHAH